MAAVGGGVNQHIVRLRGDAAVERDFQRLVAALALLETQVIAKDDEALRPPGDQVDDIGQIGQVALVDLDQAQALRRILVQASLDQRRLAGAAGAGQQHVVGRPALHELLRILLYLLLLRRDIVQIIQTDVRDMCHRLQESGALTAALAPAESGGALPVGCMRRRRQDGFEARQQRFGTEEKLIELCHGEGGEIQADP